MTPDVFSIFMIIAGVTGGAYCLYLFSLGLYEALLPGLCSSMAAVLETNWVLTLDSSPLQLVAWNAVEMGFILSVCSLLKKRYDFLKKEVI